MDIARGPRRARNVAANTNNGTAANRNDQTPTTGGNAATHWQSLGGGNSSGGGGGGQLRRVTPVAPPAQLHPHQLAHGTASRDPDAPPAVRARPAAGAGGFLGRGGDAGNAFSSNAAAPPPPHPFRLHRGK